MLQSVKNGKRRGGIVGASGYRFVDSMPKEDIEMCEYCGSERKPIFSEIKQTSNSIISTVIGFDEEGYLVTSTMLQTAHTLPPYHLQSKNIVNVCPMCGKETGLYKKETL